MLFPFPIDPNRQRGSLSKQWQDFKRSLRNTPEAFRLVWKADRGQALLAFGLTPLMALIPAAQAWVGKLIVDRILDAANQRLPVSAGFQMVLPFLAMELGLVLLSSVLNQLGSLANQNLSLMLSNYVNTLIIAKANQLELQFFEDPVFYDLLQNARRQADRAALSIVNAILQVAQQIITLISVLVILLRYSPWLALVVLAAAIPNFISTTLYAEKSFRIISRRAPEARLLSYLEQLLTGNESVKEIKLFGLGEPLLNRYEQLFTKFFEEDKAINRKSTLSSLVWGLLGTAAYYASYAWVILKTIAKIFTLGDMTMFLSIFRQSQSSVMRLLSSFSQLYESNLYLDNLMTYLNLEPSLMQPPKGLIAPTKIESGIEFRHVSFKYPGSDALVLKDINFTIAPRERIALVGLNGAGKTTLIKLLTRLYDPTEGQIFIDGIDLRQFDLKTLHQRFGVIFQDFVRYQFSVRENIAFGQIEKEHNLKQIKEAAERSGADSFIQTLPEAYETTLGRRWEKGAELSGGQWQKIALARAFMRNAEVMILDEPTSALDAQAEYEVFEHFGELMQDRIAVLISHRFSTVRMADRILVLSEGHISEFGSHAQLMANDGPYAKLFNLQAEGYR
ncbi:MAG: ABC transporter ATP-binding protein [Anaerolineaceae bacterium]|nr:ABC transporter ATP-binding protein [Anaerolineaceae bacterium]